MDKENIFSENSTDLLSPEEDKLSQEDNIIKELLKLACDTSVLTGKTIGEKIDKILEIRVENELMLNQLLKVGTIHDQIGIEEAAKINNRSKDSLSDLIKIKQLLAGEATERISVEDEGNQFRMDRLAGMRN